MCLSWVKKYSFFGKFGVLCLLEAPVLRIAFCLITGDLCFRRLTLSAGNLFWHWVAAKSEHDIEFALLWISFRENNNYSDKWSWLEKKSVKWNFILFITAFGCLSVYHFLAWNYYTKLYRKMKIISISNVSTIGNTSTTVRQPTKDLNQDSDWHLIWTAW